jgi:Fur family iron response transcriptional regulator
MTVSVDSLRGRLQAHGVGATAQRLEIANLVLGEPQHVTAEIVLGRLAARGKRVSKATVYNTLNLFAAKGLLRQLTVDPDVTWFDSNTGAHFHVQHVETGALMDVDPAKLSLVGLPPPPEGTEVVGIEVVIRVRSKTS